METYDLKLPPRESGRKEKIKRVHAVLGSRPNSLSLKNEQGELTFWGVYSELQLIIQNYYGWENDTCVQYDTIVNEHIAPAFGDRAFEELDDLDIYDAWARIMKSVPTIDKMKKAYRNIRVILYFAHKHGYTTTTLWGIPNWEEPQIGTDNTKPKEEKDEEEGKQLAKAKLHNQVTLPLEIQIKICKLMLEDYVKEGRMLGGLIATFCDVRPGELIGLRFRNFQEVRPGMWGLTVAGTGTKKRKVQARGKTKNFPRPVYVPRFLALKILGRRAELEEIYGDVSDFPIVCYKRQYTRPCTSKEVNDIMKSVYRECGGPEALYQLACVQLLNDKDLREKYGRSPTTYLLRHQAITAYVACGLKEGEIYAAAGHKMEDPKTKKSDFSNPDCFEEMAKKINRSPLVQYFEQTPQYQRIEITNLTREQPLDVDGSAEIYFERDCEFRFKATSDQPCSPLHFSTEGIQIQMIEPDADYREVVPTSISLRTLFCQYAQDVGAKVDAQEENEIMVAAPAMRIPGHLERLARGEMMLPGSSINGVPLDPFGPNVKSGNGQSAPTGPEPVVLELQNYARSAATVYLADAEKKLMPMKPAFPIKKTGKKGEKLAENMPRTLRVERVVAHVPEQETYVLARDGRIYHAPAGTHLESLERDGEEREDSLLAALKNGGILLQRTSQADSDCSSLVCVGDRGGIRRISMDCLGKIPADGKCFIAFSGNDTRIAAACICAKNDDILLVTAQGKGLRLLGENLRNVRSCGVQLIAGIALEQGDEPIACLPYRAGAEYLVAKAYGKIACVDCTKTELRASGRNAGGVEFVLVPPGDKVVSVLPACEAVLAVTRDGSGLCVASDQIPGYKRGAKGVQICRLKDGNTVVALCEMKKE